MCDVETVEKKRESVTE